MPGVTSTCSKCGASFFWDTDLQEAPFCPKCGYDTVYDGKRNKCEKCGGGNLWTTVGNFSKERRCLDCVPPPPDAAQKVAKLIKQIKQDVPNSARCIRIIENIGPAGKAALPLLRRIYAKHGKNDAVGCAAKDVLRNFELNKGKAGCFIATACYGCADAPEVLVLRQYRDTYLVNSVVGRMLVSMYYALSPRLATFIGKRSSLRWIVRVGFVNPVVRVLKKAK